MDSLVKESATVGKGSTDLFGNVKDRKVGYARGAILRDEVSEVTRQRRAYGLIRSRFERDGDSGIYNLTGLIRGFPLKDEDKPYLPSYIHFIARYQNDLETLALRHLGGDPDHHDCFLSTRVSAGMLAIMLTLLERDAKVLSLVVADSSHPSVSQAVRIAGGQFSEVIGLDAYVKAFDSGVRPDAVVITTISPSKKHLPQADTIEAIAIARKHGALVILDDAHMAARISIYDEKPGLALDADATVWSLDKHMVGPRSGMVAGKKEYLAKIKARALALGVEAQLGQVLAGLRAVQQFDPSEIRKAHRMAGELFTSFNADCGGHAYMAGAGVALSGDRLLEAAVTRSGKQPAIVPIEAVAFTAMRLLESFGAVTIPAVGMPGASCTYRLMLYPDGLKMGVDALLSASREVFNELADVVDKPQLVRPVLLS